MSDPSDRPLDAATRAVLGTESYLERLEPESPDGRRLLSALEWFGPADGDRWREEIDGLERTEDWVDSEPESARTLRGHLGELPETTSYESTLDSGATLGEGALFELKKFCHHAKRALEAAGRLVEESDRPDDGNERLGALIATIHPGGEGSPRFHLAAELDDDLQGALERRRQVESELRELRESVEEDVVDELGGSFDLQGRYRPPDGAAPDDYDDHANLAYDGGEWYAHSQRLAELRDEYSEARRRLDSVEAAVREDLSDALRPHVQFLSRTAAFLARLDLRIAKVRLKREIDGCWGRWEEDDGVGFTFSEGQEPRLARRLAGEDEAIQPIDFTTAEEPTVVTGPNMGGKSALLVLTGLCHWCAQYALPVPARSFSFHPFEAIVYVGSEEPNAVDASRGLSSFGREVRRLAVRLERTEPPTLWLLDEIGRGTHPKEGAAMAIEFVERLDRRGDRVVAATHFPELAESTELAHARIRGIVDREALESELSARETLVEIETALREAMDFQPEPTDDGAVPHDARLVARALGLDARDD